jgi:hypothetical protein
MLSRSTVIAGIVLGLSLGLQAPCVFGQIIGQQPVVGGQRLQGQTNQQQQQQQQQMMRQQMMPQPVTTDGTITAMSGGIMVTDKTNKIWKVTVPSEATVHVTGTATIEYLQAHPKLTVEFKAEFDDQGAIKDKVSELTIVSPKDEKQGMVPEGAAAANNDAAGAKSAKHGAKTPAKSNAVHGTPTAGSYHVVGKLSEKTDKFYVQIHGMPKSVELPLADQVTIKVDMADVSLAAVGDNINVSGTGTPPKFMMSTRGAKGEPGIVQASDVKIEMAEQLTGVKKKSASHVKKDKEDSATPPAN